MKTESLSREIPGCRDQESGLFHRDHFLAALELELARLDRGSRPLSLALVELPRAADWAAFGRLALDALRPIDLAARLSDRRAGFLFPEAGAARARRRLADFLVGLEDGTGSVGLALAQPREGRSAGEMLTQAERNLREDGPRTIDRRPEADPATAIAAEERGLLFDGFRTLEAGRRL